jgi:hypothetical protein
MVALQFFESSGTTFSMTQLNILQHLNL